MSKYVCNSLTSSTESTGFHTVEFHRTCFSGGAVVLVTLAALVILLYFCTRYLRRSNRHRRWILEMGGAPEIAKDGAASEGADAGVPRGMEMMPGATPGSGQIDKQLHQPRTPSGVVWRRSPRPTSPEPSITVQPHEPAHFSKKSLFFTC